MADLPTSYAGGASPDSLSWPETSLSNCVFKSYRESPRRMVKRSMGLLSTVETDSADCREGMRSSPLNNPRTLISRVSTKGGCLTTHGQDGGVAAESS